MKSFSYFKPRPKKARSEVEANLDAFLMARIETGQC